MLIDYFNNLFEFLADHPQFHARGSSLYRFVEGLTTPAFHEAQPAFEAGQKVPLAELGLISLPYEKMGAIDSIDLFGLDELLMFSFYYRNRGRYARAADIGANLGLHSILMAKCGWLVTAYEPDPDHAKRLSRNLGLNSITTVTLAEAAVSDKPGTLEFIRVLGNTTSSHLAGAKSNAYGPLEKFHVKVESIATIMPIVDFVKMDAEGQEKIIILGTTTEHWRNTDMIVEVGTEENAAAIYEHLQKIGVRAFAQKLGWAAVKSLTDMPSNYKDGSLFITQKAAMPWA